MAIRGTKHRMSVTDYFMACKSCRRLFYFPHYVNGENVECPYCGCRH